MQAPAWWKMLRAVEKCPTRGSPRAGEQAETAPRPWTGSTRPWVTSTCLHKVLDRTTEGWLAFPYAKHARAAYEMWQSVLAKGKYGEACGHACPRKCIERRRDARKKDARFVHFHLKYDFLSCHWKCRSAHSSARGAVGRRLPTERFPYANPSTRILRNTREKLGHKDKRNFKRYTKYEEMRTVGKSVYSRKMGIPARVSNNTFLISAHAFTFDIFIRIYRDAQSVFC